MQSSNERGGRNNAYTYIGVSFPPGFNLLLLMYGTVRKYSSSKYVKVCAVVYIFNIDLTVNIVKIVFMRYSSLRHMNAIQREGKDERASQCSTGCALAQN